MMITRRSCKAFNFARAERNCIYLALEFFNTPYLYIRVQRRQKFHNLMSLAMIRRNDSDVTSTYKQEMENGRNELTETDARTRGDRLSISFLQ